MDKGPEFLALDLRYLCYRAGINACYIDPVSRDRTVLSKDVMHGCVMSSERCGVLFRDRCTGAIEQLAA
jgi:hypothetical protein